MVEPAEISLDELLKALLDDEKPFQPKYLYRLSDLDGAELARLQNAWPRVSAWRRQALMEDVEALGARDLVLSFEALARLATRDPLAQVRRTAIHVLDEYDPTAGLADLYLRLLKGDADAEVRAAAASGLGAYVYAGEVEDLPAQVLRRVENGLLQCVQSDASAGVRRNALEALGFSGRPEVPALIERAFASGDRQQIASALCAMGRSANPAWQPQVLAMLTSEQVDLRYEAARAAGELELHEATPLLLELTHDSDESVRQAGVWALSTLGGEGVQERLAEMYASATDEEEAEFLTEALDNLSLTEGNLTFHMMDIGDEADEEDDAEEADVLDWEDDLLAAIDEEDEESDDAEDV